MTLARTTAPELVESSFYLAEHYPMNLRSLELQRIPDEARFKVDLSASFALEGFGASRMLLSEIEYDSYGNWTRKTRLTQPETSVKPQPYHADLREIKYY
jgi:hypothetical protein